MSGNELDARELPLITETHQIRINSQKKIG